MQAAGGGGGGGGGEDDDGDDNRGPPSGGPNRGFNPPGPGGPPMATYPPVAPTRMNVIAHEHADFRLTMVNAQSFGTFSSNCLNAFVLEPGFNPVNRISPSLQDLMVQQENRNLLQRSRVNASGTPAYGSAPMINRQTLFHIGMQGEQGLRHIMQILISMLGSREHWQADILSAFQRYDLPGCALQDIKIFLRQLTENVNTYFQILELPCSPDLASQIIRERDGALKTACTRPGVQNNWYNRFTAAKLEAKSKIIPVLANLNIYLQMLDYTLLEFEEAVPFLGESRTPVAAINAPPQRERHNRGNIANRPHDCQWTLHFGSYNDRTTVFN